VKRVLTVLRRLVRRVEAVKLGTSRDANGRGRECVLT
jgi:hypothetical protein